MPIKQDRSCDESVKTENDESQCIALAEFNEEAVDGFAPRLCADKSETISGYFCGSVWRTIPQKPGGMKRAIGQTASVRTAGARGQGERNSLWQS